MDANQTNYSDKEILMDLLNSQKSITSNYNSYANECATPAIKTDFVNILSEEHQLQNEVFSEMQKRGWYQTEAAQQDKINQAKQKYTAGS